jgi:hypothetical protein
LLGNLFFPRLSGAFLALWRNTGHRVGISFHITSVREGTIFNVMQFLGLEHVTGTLTVRFGREIPEVNIFFDSGKIATAVFGQVLGAPVLDVLLCQEFAIKEVSFRPGE